MKQLLIVPQFVLALAGVLFTALSSLLVAIANVFIQLSYLLDDLRNG
jgi:hypothetical protein